MIDDSPFGFLHVLCVRFLKNETRLVMAIPKKAMNEKINKRIVVS